MNNNNGEDVLRNSFKVLCCWRVCEILKRSSDWSRFRCCDLKCLLKLLEPFVGKTLAKPKWAAVGHKCSKLRCDPKTSKVTYKRKKTSWFCDYSKRKHFFIDSRAFQLSFKIELQQRSTTYDFVYFILNNQRYQ